MNKKIAQQKTPMQSYFDVLFGEYPRTITKEERNVINKVRNVFRKELAAFRNTFDNDSRAKYAIKKLLEKYKNTKISDKNIYLYGEAAKEVENNYYLIMEKVKEDVKKEFEFGAEDESLDFSSNFGGEPWTFVQWKNTLVMMYKRAYLQFREIKNSDKEEKIKNIELNIKKDYASKVKYLLNKLNGIVNGDNPENKKLAPNEVIPDSWLMGTRGGRGGRGGRYPGDNRGYPGSSRYLDEGFSEQQQQQRFLNFPFGKGNRQYDYLYVHDLLRAYGLDSKPQYRILMGKGSRRELPGRIWRSLDPYNALDTLGNDKAFFYKYVPALNAALNEIIDIYTQEADNKHYDPKQVDMGKQYEAATKSMMLTMKMQAPKRRQVTYR